MNNLCNENFILILIFVLFAYLLFQINNIKNSSENFGNALNDTALITVEVINQISNIYQADVQAIRNLSAIAKGLTSGNNTVIPGAITISGQLTTDTATINNLTVNGDINGLNLLSMNTTMKSLSETLNKITAILNNQSSQQVYNSQTSRVANSQASVTNSQASNIANSQAVLTANLQNNLSLQLGQNYNLQGALNSQIIKDTNIINSEIVRNSNEANIMNSQELQISGQQGIINSEIVRNSNETKTMNSQGIQISGQQGVINSETAQISVQQGIINSEAIRNSNEASIMNSQGLQITGQQNALTSQVLQNSNLAGIVNSQASMAMQSIARSAEAQASNNQASMLKASAVQASQNIAYSQARASTYYNFMNIIATIPPWGMYSADAWNASTNVLYDLTKNKRDAITNGVTQASGAGSGAKANVTYLTGNPSHTIIWAEGSIPRLYTVAGTTRYIGGNMNRILNSVDNAYIFGHHGNVRGRFLNSNWYAPTQMWGNQQDWAVGVVTNNSSVAAPGNCIIDNAAIGNWVGGNPGISTMSINGGGETSDFAFNNLIIWDQPLTAAQMMTVSNAMNQMLSEGVTINSLLPKIMALKSPQLSMNYSITSSLTAQNMSIYNNLIKLCTAIPPWGIYSADNWSNNTLFDIGINNRNAITNGVIQNNSNGNGANASIPYLYGSNNNTITWPGGSIPTQYTVAGVTRYLSNRDNNRILNSVDNNFIFGHHATIRGRFYNNGQWYAGTSQYGFLTDWLVGVCTNNKVSLPNNCFVDNNPVGSYSGGNVGTGTMTINGGGEQSRFAFNQLMIWDQPLTAQQMALVSNALTAMLNDGMTLNKLWKLTYTQTQIDQMRADRTSKLYINFINILISIPPWGMYSADTWDPSTNILPDLTGNKRDATTNGVTQITSSGNGAATDVTYLSGNPSNTIIWAEGSIPRLYTVAGTTRYVGSNMNRILNSVDNAYIFGHHGNVRGRFLNSNWYAPTQMWGNQQDWAVGVVTNNSSVAAPGNCIIDNTAIGNWVGGNPGISTMSINGGGETSNFAFSNLIIWDQPLTAAQMMTVSVAMNQMLSDGTTINSLIPQLSSMKAPTVSMNLASINTLISTDMAIYNDLIKLFNSIPPWGIYSADNWSNNTLFDIGINNNHAITNGVLQNNTNGNGANVSIPYLYGSNNNTIIWPGGSIPTQYTVAGVTRYLSNRDCNRILNSVDNNFIFGHHGSIRGRFYNNGQWYAGTSQYGFLTDWLVGVNNNNVGNPYSCIIDNNPVGSYSGGNVGTGIMSINGGGEQSRFAFNQLIIWDTPLNPSQLMVVSNALTNMLNDGMTLNRLLNLTYSSAQIAQMKAAQVTNKYKILKDLLAALPPWGMYSADAWSSNTLNDLTGNNRNATTSGVSQRTATGNGANGTITYLFGASQDKILWPNGSIPSTYTVLGVTRYIGTNMNRILNSVDNSFIFGHHGNVRGRFLNSNWYAPTQMWGNQTDWAVGVVTNNTSVAVPGNCIIDNTAIGNWIGGNPGTSQMSINGGGETSDFNFSQLIIWDRPLTAAQMMSASVAMNLMLNDGMTLKKLLGK